MARSGLACWLWLALGCAPSVGTPEASTLPTQTPTSAAPSSRTPSTPAPNEAERSKAPALVLGEATQGALLAVATEPDSSEAEPSGALAPKPRVVLETPHRFGGRPVPEGAIAASTHDTELAVWNRGGSSTERSSAEFHPATRVILDTRVLSGKKSLGRLGADGIRAQTRAQGYWPFRLCFEEGVRQGASASGSVVLRFSIDARGKVSYARKMRSDLPEGVTSCARKAAYQPKYRPAPPRRVDVEVTARLSPGDVGLPGRDPRALSLGSEALRSALAGLAPSVGRCYAEGLERDPELWGRVELRLVRDEAGAVVRADELGSSFPDAGVRDCVRAAFVDQELPLASEPDLVVAWRLGERK